MAKLQAKTEEQRLHIANILGFAVPIDENGNGISTLCYVEFDTLAEIVDYLRSKNCEQEIAKYEEYNRLLEENRKLFNECERLKKENEILKKKTKRLPQIATLNKRIHQLKQENEYLVTQLEAKLEEDARKYIIENQ